MLDTIFNRRSIRKYKEKPVEQTKIDTILRAAMYSPTGTNSQLWEFMVVEDREKIDDFHALHPYSKMLDSAPVMLMVLADMTKSRTPTYYLGDCGAAAQTILLAAYELSLGTCWLGIPFEGEMVDKVREIFSLPEHIKPFCAIALGYPDEIKETAERFDPAKIHHNQW